MTSVSCTVSVILPLLLYVPACDPEKSFSFDTTVEVTDYIDLTICI